MMIQVVVESGRKTLVPMAMLQKIARYLMRDRMVVEHYCQILRQTVKLAQALLPQILRLMGLGVIDPAEI